MSTDLDERYFTWLVSQVASVKKRAHGRTFWSLLRMLHQKEFVGWVPNDLNRAKDGQQLQHEFLQEEGIEGAVPYTSGCSMLEMLIAISRRLSFDTDRRPKWWFWHLMKNIGLENYADDVPFTQEEVDEVLDAIIWRTYAPNGVGGLFPLERPPNDQRQVELWFQLNAYLLERY